MTDVFKIEELMDAEVEIEFELKSLEEALKLLPPQEAIIIVNKEKHKNALIFID